MFLPATLIIAALSFFAEASLLTPRSGLAIPIAKRNQVRNSKEVVDLAVLERSVRHSLAKVQLGFSAHLQNTGNHHPSSPKAKRAESEKRSAGKHGSEPLLNYAYSTLWYGNITVGTPPQNFTVEFDTGSPDFFIPSSSCGRSCKGHEKYNDSNSCTSHALKKKFQLEYGRGSVNGTLYRDDVTVAGYTAKNLTIGAAKNISSEFNIANFLPDGLFGLAFPRISAYNATPFFQTLVAQGDLPSKSFGLYLAQEGSELYLGGTNKQLYEGNFTHVPLIHEGYWQIDLDSLHLDGQKIIGITNSIVDTGTTLIVGDPETVQAFYDQIPGSAYFESGMYTVPCSFDTEISLQFGGVKFAVDPQTFNMGAVSEYSTDCVGGIMAFDDIPFWVIGDVFLRNVYTKFDVGKKRVGFAKLAK